MVRSQFSIRCFAMALVLIVSHFALADEPAEKPDDARVSKVFRLQNVDVTKAAHTILNLLDVRQSQSESQSLATVATEAKTNSLVVSANAETMEYLEQLIAVMDKRPTIVRIKIEVIELDAEGSENILSRPQIMTIDGRTAAMFVGGDLNLDSNLNEVPLTKEAALRRQGLQLEIEPQVTKDSKLVRLKLRIHRQVMDETMDDEVTLRVETVLTHQTVELDKSLKVVVTKTDDGQPKMWANILTSLVVDDQD